MYNLDSINKIITRNFEERKQAAYKKRVSDLAEMIVNKLINLAVEEKVSQLKSSSHIKKDTVVYRCTNKSYGCMVDVYDDGLTKYQEMEKVVEILKSWDVDAKLELDRKNNKLSVIASIKVN